MSVREIVAGLRKRLVRSKVETGDWAGYKGLMQEILDGKEIDPSEAEAILESVIGRQSSRPGCSMRLWAV
jgi:hypothetical protein